MHRWSANNRHLCSQWKCEDKQAQACIIHSASIAVLQVVFYLWDLKILTKVGIWPFLTDFNLFKTDFILLISSLKNDGNTWEYRKCTHILPNVRLRSIIGCRSLSRRQCKRSSFRSIAWKAVAFVESPLFACDVPDYHSKLLGFIVHLLWAALLHIGSVCAMLFCDHVNAENPVNQRHCLWLAMASNAHQRTETCSSHHPTNATRFPVQGIGRAHLLTGEFFEGIY